MFHPARLATFAAFCLSMLPVHAAGSSWKTDFEAARKQAAAEDKVLLIDFTGSDWCTWCVKLRMEVFVQPEFEAGTKDRFVLVELDYPKDKKLVPEAVARQNAELLKKYPVSGYPTVLLCDAAGKPFATTGYRPDGPVPYLAHLGTLLEKKTARDLALSHASNKEGVAKAKALVAALDGLELGGDMIRSCYPEITAAIRAADPADETGFAKKQDGEIKLAGFLVALGEQRSKQDLDGAMKLVEATLADPTTTGDFRQQVYGHQAGTLASSGKKEEAIAVLKKAVEEDPKGDRTEELKQFIEILQREQAGLPPAKPQPKAE